MTTTAQDTRRFYIAVNGERFMIRELPASAPSYMYKVISRQEAWDQARAQERPVTFTAIDGTRTNLGIVYDHNASWAAMKVEAAKREAEQERAAYEAEMATETAHVQPTAFHEGYFTLGRQIVLVMLNRARTRHYARVLNPATGHWSYEAGLMAHWKSMKPLTREDAKAFGDLHHYCLAYGCGRELTNPVSIERGIGPVCAEKLGLL